MSLKSISKTKVASNYIRDVTTGVAWTKPADWLTLETLNTSSQKIVANIAIYNNDSNYVAFTCTGAHII